MPPIVILNPASAGGTTKENWPVIKRELRAQLGDFAVEFTQSVGDGQRIAAEAARNGRTLIIACGGDGTISEVANGILDSACDAELGVLPSGTGSDLCRTLRTPKNSAAAARALRDSERRYIDAIHVTFMNDRGERETRLSINVASFGLSTAVLQRRGHAGAGKWLSRFVGRKLARKLSYAVASVQSMFSFTPNDIVVQIDKGPEQHLRVTEFCVANTRYYGGGMKIAPHAVTDDGFFDVVTIGDVGGWRLFANSLRFYSGTHLKMREVTHVLAQQVIAHPVKEIDNVSVELDGEIVGRLPAIFQLIPRALRVRCAPARRSRQCGRGLRAATFL